MSTRTSILFVTPARDRALPVQAHFGDRLSIAEIWSRSNPPSEVLLLDLAAMLPSDWTALELWSKASDRPALLLLDDLGVTREQLSRVAADALLSADAEPRHVIASIEEYACERVFRNAAERVTCRQLSHPLGAFLSAAFTGRINKVGRLAASRGFKESTLRNQWRAFRSDPTLRLEDVLDTVAELRASVPSTGMEDLRQCIQDLEHRIFGSG